LLRELFPLILAGLVPIAVLVLIVTGTAFNLVAWQPPIMQTIQFGTANSENGITAISSDSTGVYIAGFAGWLDVIPSYLFVTRYDLSLHQVWTQHSNNPDFSLTSGIALAKISGIAVGKDGVYVAGFANSSSFVKGYDLNGDQVWNSTFGNAGYSATAVSVGRNGVYVVGYENRTSYFLRDYGINGSLVWTQLAGTYVTDNAGVFADAGGVYIMIPKSPGSLTITGSSLLQKYDLNGTLEWTRTCQCDSAQITGDSTNIYVAGTVQTARGASDGFIGKYDQTGNQVWTTNFSAPGFNGINAVQISADPSGVYLSSTTSNARGIVMGYDSNGIRAWSLLRPWETGNGNLLSPSGMITVQEAGVYVGGTMTLGSSAYPAFMAQISKSTSLVFFGINPPFSFGLVTLLAVAAVASVLWLRAIRKKRLRISRTERGHRSPKAP